MTMLASFVGHVVAKTTPTLLQDSASVVDGDSSLDKLKVSLILISAIAVPSFAHLVGKAIEGSSWTHRVVWSAAFALNLIAVCIPGRFDGQMKDGKISLPWVTFFQPAEWAFAIWGVIYLGEMLLTAYCTVQGKPVAILRNAAPFWLAGNIFQSLWCLSFRPQFIHKLWLPAIFLLAGTTSFGACHGSLTAAMQQLGPGVNAHKIGLLFIRAPIALHTAWLAGAVLLNINGWAVVANASSALQIALAFTSSFVASIAGTYLTLRTKDPLISATVAWILIALSAKTKEKMVVIPADEAPRDVYEALALAQDWLAKFMQLVTLGITTDGIIRNLF